MPFAWYFSCLTICIIFECVLDFLFRVVFDWIFCVEFFLFFLCYIWWATHEAREKANCIESKSKSQSNRANEPLRLKVASKMSRNELKFENTEISADCDVDCACDACCAARFTSHFVSFRFVSHCFSLCVSPCNTHAHLHFRLALCEVDEHIWKRMGKPRGRGSIRRYPL